MSTTALRVAIIGGGIGGVAAANALLQRGMDVHVYEQAVVSFANGERVVADVVVAADGIHSTLQQYVVAPSAPLPSGSVAYRGIVSAASVSWPAGAMRNWLGAGKHFLVYPCAPMSS
jgi:2-polyprenyl-6-methoxyphenol hydroxylase-like FAD-dependent oxidoreductase